MEIFERILEELGLSASEYGPLVLFCENGETSGSIKGLKKRSAP
jgi:hypothetical protein